ncbi:MAG TPA: DUF6220 domain-containing protein [Streptosporangiaceae bacterium]
MTHTTDHTSAVTGQRVLTGYRRKIDVVYVYLSALFVVGVLAQVFLAGVGVFGMNAPKVADSSSFDAHRGFGFVLMVISLLLLVLALVARQSMRTTISTLVLALLTVIAQSVLASLGDNNKWLGGLHALDGMLILLLALWIAFLGWLRVTRRSRPSASTD